MVAYCSLPLPLPLAFGSSSNQIMHNTHTSTWRVCSETAQQRQQTVHSALKQRSSLPLAYY
jgi:hypothetical protein